MLLAFNFEVKVSYCTPCKFQFICYLKDCQVWGESYIYVTIICY
jgi:hypothetical protein